MFQINLQLYRQYNNISQRIMHNSYLKPLLNYGRFILEEERKRKIVETQLPKIVLPKLLFQRNPLQPYTTTEITDTLPHFKFNFNLCPFPQSMFIQSVSAKYEVQSQKLPEKQQESWKNSIFSKQYAANTEIEDRISIGVVGSLDNSLVINVFDGHGGYLLAEYCSLNFIEVFDQILAAQIQKNPSKQLISDLIIKSLKNAYQKLEDDFYDNIYQQSINVHPQSSIRHVGTCGISVLVYDGQIYVANCGDSQAILVSKNQQQKHHQFRNLSERLSVNNPHQRNRLLTQFEDQDIITQQSRGVFYLKGRLQPTRTLGDFYLKKKQQWKSKKEFKGPYLHCIPDVNVYNISEDSVRVMVASDGIWDFIDKWALTKLSAVPYGRKQLNICEFLVDETLKRIAKMHGKKIQELLKIRVGEKRNYHDDISLIVIELQDYKKVVKLKDGLIAKQEIPCQNRKSNIRFNLEEIEFEEENCQNGFSHEQKTLQYF